MGVITVAAFRPHKGKEADLLRVVADRLPLLRSLGLSTDRPSILMRSRDGVIIEISEWSSPAAIEKAHETPEVLALWERFFAICDHVNLSSLAEAGEDFATFEPIEYPEAD